MKIERVPLSVLSLDPSNTRAHDERNLEAIKASLQRFGQVEPLVVQEATKRVVGGNGRLQAMRALGWTEADVALVDLNDVQATALSIALNRTGELASWDMDALKRTLDALEEAGEMDGVGFAPDEIDKLFPPSADEIEDVEPEAPPVHAKAKPGELWILGSHRLLCGDSTSEDDVRRLLDGEKPFLMVTDPPYGVNYDPEWRHETGLNNSDRVGKVANDDRVDWTEAWRLFPGAVAYVWHAGRFAADVLMQLVSCDLEVRAQIIWAKPRFAISRGHYHWQHEPCWYAVRDGESARWCGDRTQSTVWQIGQREGNDVETVHGTQKPVEAMARPIRNHGARGDGVYEPFSGSGTTLIACEQLERRCFAMEINPAYVDVAIQRWQKLTGKDAVLDGTGERFNDRRLDETTVSG